MKQKALYILAAVLVLIAGFFLLTKHTPSEPVVVTPPPPATSASYKDAEYTIDGQRIRLTNGLSEIPAAPDSASKIVTKYFGNELVHDLNGDGKDDVVFLLTQNQGGSGTFYYVVAAINTGNGYVGGEALLLGDRIAPQTTELSKDPSHQNVIIVNYADRKAGEPMTTPPSVGKSIWLKLEPKTMQFGEVAQNFEGEADPNILTLGMKTWVMVHMFASGGGSITPQKPQVFTISFKKDGKFSATTDCNGVGGNYVESKGSITFSNMISTMMYCDGSKEAAFTKLLSEAQVYRFSSKGELVLAPTSGSGSLVFK